MYNSLYRSCILNINVLNLSSLLIMSRYIILCLYYILRDQKSVTTAVMYIFVCQIAFFLKTYLICTKKRFFIEKRITKKKYWLSICIDIYLKGLPMKCITAWMESTERKINFRSNFFEMK